MKKRKTSGNYNFNKLTVDKNIEYIALGGINENNYKKIRLTKSSGFAGISDKKTPKCNLGRFNILVL